jgi:hypothetical protein
MPTLIALAWIATAVFTIGLSNRRGVPVLRASLKMGSSVWLHSKKSSYSFISYGHGLVRQPEWPLRQWAMERMYQIKENMAIQVLTLNSPAIIPNRKRTDDPRK